MDSIREHAIELWHQGYQRHLHAFALARDQQTQSAASELIVAVELYTKSIEASPTAEAYTFRGWAYQSFGRIDDAIEQCKLAIEVDPDFGNPYNDIGAYLIEQGKPDDAIEWLEKAKRAPRYEPRHYPYINLGRLYAAKGMVKKAIAEFEEALKVASEREAAHAIGAQLRQWRAMLN